MFVTPFYKISGACSEQDVNEDFCDFLCYFLFHTIHPLSKIGSESCVIFCCQRST